MSNRAKRDSIDVRLIVQCARELSTVNIVEQAYAVALNAIQEMFTPDRSFVALSEAGGPLPDGHSIQAGWWSDLAAPIHAGGRLMGRFMLQYTEPRGFSDQDIAAMELIAVQTGLAIERVEQRNNTRQAERERDELIAMAAHELRAPLTAIIGASFLLRTGRPDGNVRAVEIIERNARAQVHLIDELLNVSQLGAGRVELQLTTLDLVPVLENVVEDIQPTAAAGNTTLTTDFQRPLMVRADGQRLWQIFWNLLANSVRFASPGGEVRIAATSGSAVAKVCITDNGAGIEKDDLPHIFDRFRQGHPSSAKPRAGLGLGLAIVKDLVALHGGAVIAGSDGPGKGACFTVTIPAGT